MHDVFYKYMLYFIIANYTALNYTALNYTALNYTALNYTVLNKALNCGIAHPLWTFDSLPTCKPLVPALIQR